MVNKTLLLVFLIPVETILQQACIMCMHCPDHTRRNKCKQHASMIFVRCAAFHTCLSPSDRSTYVPDNHNYFEWDKPRYPSLESHAWVRQGCKLLRIACREELKHEKIIILSVLFASASVKLSYLGKAGLSTFENCLS